MHSKKIFVIFMAFLMLFSPVFLLPTEVRAADNRLTVYKVVNDNETKIDYFLNSEQGSLEEIQNSGKPIAGSPIYIYRVGRHLDKKDLDEKKIADLGAPFQKVSTDQTGKAVFTHLPDGRYYVRDLSSTGYLAMSFLTELPMRKGNVIMRHVTTHSKVKPPDTGGSSSGGSSSGDNETPKTDSDKKDEEKDEEKDENSQPKEEPNLPDPTQPSGFSLKQSFIKVDENTPAMPLSGSKFKVVEKVDDAGQKIYKPVMKDGSEYVLVSGADGKFEVSGIPAGSYYLVETEAPESAGKKYKLLEEPYRFELTDGEGPDELIHIRNVPLAEVATPNAIHKSTPPAAPNGSTALPGLPKTLPKTGDIGLILFLLAGCGIFFVGMRIYLRASHENKLWH